jgi:hypothetical protein
MRNTTPKISSSLGSKSNFLNLLIVSKMQDLILTDIVSQIIQEHNTAYTNLIGNDMSKEEEYLLELEDRNFNEDIEFISAVQAQLIERLKNKGCPVDEYLS